MVRLAGNSASLYVVAYYLMTFKQGADMSSIIQDTSNHFDTRYLQFREESLSLEHLCQQLELILDTHTQTLGLESLFDPIYDFREDNPFTVNTSMEEVREGYAGTSATGGLGAVAEGLARKTLRGAGKVVEGAAAGVGKAGIAVGVSLAKIAKAFIEKMTQFINTISTGISKTLATGYPLMGALIKQATTIKGSLQSSRSKQTSTFEMKKAYGLSIGGDIPDPKTIIDNLHLINEIQKTVFSRQKLMNFQEMSLQFFQPYRSTIEKHKVDPFVMTMAVLGLLTNPGQVAGVVLKKIFSAANPGMGEKIDAAATIGGGMLGGTVGLILGMGNTSASVLKQMQVGKLNISAIPKFHQYYPFCTTEEKDEKEMFITYKSPLLLGNQQWLCKDYNDVLYPYTKGSVGRVGAKFVGIKEDVDANTVKTLSPQEVGEICDTVIAILANAQAYCKQWPQYAKTYNLLYKEISDVVMAIPTKDGDGKFDVVVPYVRYSYRNALNVMLGSIWKNCFGSDNTFVRYLVSTCRLLLQYCQQSLEAGEAQEEENNENTDS